MARVSKGFLNLGNSIIVSCHHSLLGDISAVSFLVLVCAHFFFFNVVQINYISLTFLAGPIFSHSGIWLSS